MNKIKLKRFCLVLTFASALVVGIFASNPISAEGNLVHVIELNDATINPITAEYITKSIDKAYEDRAQCLIIRLDTPGGLLTSTRMIVKKILTANVPVVVYVSPSGSRAGSAGVFITYASHVAAMAPSTNIGAAHPVQLDGGKKDKDNGDFWDAAKELIKEKREKEKAEEEKDKEKAKDKKKSKKSAKGGKDKEAKEVKAEDEKIKPDSDPMSSKILQDTVAFIKAIAEKRNRNVEWAVKSVTKSSSVTEKEALELGVVEIVADDLSDLLKQLDGRVVKIDQKEVTLNTKDTRIVTIKMDFRQRFFNVLANPNIAYILMILGFYGLLYEITHPGIGVPGVLGTIFLILAFFSMQTLPTNYAGLALVVLGIILFIAEAYVPGFGLLTLGGLVSLILGSMLLFDSSVPMMRVSTSLIFSFSFATAALTLFLVKSVIQAHKSKVLSGKAGMIGEKGEAKASFKANQEGKVYVHGELWNAVSTEDIKKGDKVVVTHVDGMTITVKKS